MKHLKLLLQCYRLLYPVIMRQIVPGHRPVNCPPPTREEPKTEIERTATDSRVGFHIYSTLLCVSLWLLCISYSYICAPSLSLLWSFLFILLLIIIIINFFNFMACMVSSRTGSSTVSGNSTLRQLEFDLTMETAECHPSLPQRHMICKRDDS